MVKIFEKNEWLDDVTQLYTPESGDVTQKYSDVFTKKGAAGFIMDAPENTFIVKCSAGIHLPDAEIDPVCSLPADISISNGNFVLDATEGDGELEPIFLGEGNGLSLTLQRHSTFKIIGSWVLYMGSRDDMQVDVNLYDSSTFEINLAHRQNGIAGEIGGTITARDNALFILEHARSGGGESPLFQGCVMNVFDNARISIIADSIAPSTQSHFVIHIDDGAPHVEVRSQSGKSDPLQLENQEWVYPGIFNFSRNSKGRVTIDVPAGDNNAFGKALLKAKNSFAIDGRSVDIGSSAGEFTVQYGSATRSGVDVGTIIITKK